MSLVRQFNSGFKDYAVQLNDMSVDVEQVSTSFIQAVEEEEYSDAMDFLKDLAVSNKAFFEDDVFNALRDYSERISVSHVGVSDFQVSGDTKWNDADGMAKSFNDNNLVFNDVARKMDHVKNALIYLAHDNGLNAKQPADEQSLNVESLQDLAEDLKDLYSQKLYRPDNFPLKAHAPESAVIPSHE